MGTLFHYTLQKIRGLVEKNANKNQFILQIGFKIVSLNRKVSYIDHNPLLPAFLLVQNVMLLN